MEYVHLELGEDVHGLAGYYTPTKELRLPYDGREVLIVVGISNVESACCGGGTSAYANIPGYIVEWKSDTSDAGLAVSHVEPVTDDSAKRDIARDVRETEHVFNVDFW
jgi:hypothetical protein